MCDRPSNEELQIIAKQAVRKLGMQIHFCAPCLMIMCSPKISFNNWTATGCGCCRLGHDLLEKE